MSASAASASSRTAQQLVVRFESPEQGGVKLVKTYTLKRGAYDIACARGDQHRAAPGVARSSTCSWCATATSAGRIAFYSGPSPARRSTPSQEVPEGRVQRHRQEQGRLREAARPTAMWPWCSTTSPAPGSCPTACARELRAQGGHQPVLGGHDHAAARVAPGASAGRRFARCSWARRKRRCSSARAGPGPGQGLRLADHPGQAAVLAAGQDPQLRGQLGLVDRGCWCW
jgi:hypothetical protein